MGDSPSRPDGISSDRWERLSHWHNEWLAADSTARERLRERLRVENPDLAADADQLIAPAADVTGFLETPAFVLAAAEQTTEDPLLAPGTHVGPYRIDGLLARGGMGDVYRATDVRLDRRVALKVLAVDRTSGDDRVDRFVQEARVTASLDHPNIVRLYDVGFTEDRPYFVAELLEGETLRRRIERGPLEIGDAVRIAVDIAKGLTAAHAAGSVHRDLKPENIFLTQQGVTKILDFGIAKLAPTESMRDAVSTLTGVVLGTAGYLAPEQVRGDTVDQRTDLFALGVILFEMLTSRRPFARDHIIDTLHAIVHEAAPDLTGLRADVPPGLAGTVARLLEKVPADRFPTARDLEAALTEAVTRPTVSLGTAQTASSDALKPKPRRPLWPAALAAGFLTMVVATGVMYWRGQTAPAASGNSTLAIFPFRSLPGGADSELMELGLADVVISRLTQLPDVRVLPLSATERLRTIDPVQAGARLGADRVLTGTVQRDEQRVRATVQLMSVDDGRTVWSTTFDADATSPFSIQDAVVGRVLQEIAPTLTSTTRTRLASSGTHNGEAYEEYLRGRAYAAQVTGATFARAIESYRRAVTLDPAFADAWAALGSAYRRLPIVGDAEPNSNFGAARDAAQRALKLAPDHPEAEGVLATVAFWYEWDYPRAERLFRSSLAKQPLAETSFLFAHLLSNLGRHDEALAEVRRARALDPVSSIARALEGQFLFMARRHDEALANLNVLVELAPGFVQGHIIRAYPLISLGMYDDAVRSLDRAIEIEDRVPRPPSMGRRVFPTAFRAYALARAGRVKEAEAALAQIKAQQRTMFVPSYHTALVLNGLNRRDETLTELNRAVEGRDVSVTFLGVDPKWDNLRAVPEFQAIVARANLLDVSNRIPAPAR